MDGSKLPENEVIEPIGSPWSGWILPHVPNYFIAHIQRSGLREEDDFITMQAPYLLDIFLQFISSNEGTEIYGPANARELSLYLRKAALAGYEPAQAIVPTIYQNLGLGDEVSTESLDAYLCAGISTGSVLARHKADEIWTDQQRSKLFGLSQDEFQRRGGYCYFYSALSMDLWDSKKSVISLISPEMVLDEEGNTALHYLSCFGTTELFESYTIYWRRLNASQLNTRNARGETSLYLACARGHLEMALRLLELGANPTIPSEPYQVTCLHWIIAFFDFDACMTITRKLLQNCANIDWMTTSEIPFYHYPFYLPKGSALHWAVWLGHHSAIESLVRFDADVSLRNGADPYKYDVLARPSHAITSFDNVRGGKVREPRETVMGLNALDLAAVIRDPFLPGLLHMRSKLKETTSTSNPNLSKLQHSLSHALSPDEEGYTPLHRLDSAMQTRTPSGTAYNRLIFLPIPRQTHLKTLIKSFKSLCFDINALTTPSTPEALQTTPLMVSSSFANLETTTALLECGADPNIVANDGVTALSTVGIHLNIESAKESSATIRKVMQVLLKHGADPGLRSGPGKNTVFLDLAQSGSGGEVGIILEHAHQNGTLLSLLLSPIHTNFQIRKGQKVPIEWTYFLAFLANPRRVKNSTEILERYILTLPDPGMKRRLLQRGQILRGKSLLACAAGSHNHEMVQLLLEEGVDTDQLMTAMDRRDLEGKYEDESLEGKSRNYEWLSPLDVVLDAADATRRGVFGFLHQDGSTSPPESKFQTY